MKNRWTPQATRALIKNVTSGTTDNVELAKMLDKNVASVYDKRYHLGLTEHNAPRSNPMRDTAIKTRGRWSKADKKKLSEMYHAKFSDIEIGKAMGRSEDSVKTQRRELRLVRGVTERTGAQMELYNGKTTKTKTALTLKPVKENVREFSLLWGLVKYTKG